MARQLGISRQALFLLESGRGFPSLPLAIRIARLCNRSLDEMFYQNKGNQGKEVNMFRGRFDPFSELDRLHQELDRMFSSSFRPFMRGERGSADLANPAVNVKETDKEVMLEAQLPGMTAKDTQINVTENSITLRGERKSETEEKDENFIRREYSYGSFSREIPLPTAVKAEEAQASLKNGLLTIRVPKKVEAERKSRELKIREE
jgi:HSP20 family protein